MSDSEDDFASADEGEVHTEAKKVTPVTKDPKEESKAAVADAKPTQASGDTSKKGGKQKGGSKGKEQQKKKASTSGKPAESKNVPKPSDKTSDNVTKSKPQKRNEKGKKSPQKGTTSSDKDSEQVTADSEVKQSQPDKSDEVRKASKDVGENKQSGIQEPETVKSDEPANTPEANKTDSAMKDTSKDTAMKDTSEDTALKDTSENTAKTPVNQTSLSPNDGASKEAEKATLLKSPSSQSISRPEPDHSVEEESVLTKLAEAASEKKSGWGWGWGSSLLDVASSSVSTFTSQVGEGFHTMIETVESSLNVPDPEEMANKNVKPPQGQEEATGKTPESDKSSGDTDAKETKAGTKSETKPETSESSEAAAGNQAKAGDSDNWFSAWGVSNITKMVENTSKTLVTGGLDVLETIGKKTFDVINEHDPGLKKARGLLRDRGDKPNLSGVLRDAKEQHEAQVEHEKESEEARKSHFGALFDDFQGLAHLEALEMLSNQSEKQVNTLLGALSAGQIGAMKPQLLQIKGNFEVDEEEEEEEVQEQDFPRLVAAAIADLGVPTSPDKLIKTQEKIYASLTKAQGTEEGDIPSQPKELHQLAIQSLAEFTSKSIEQFHKFGELVLLQKAQMAEFVLTSKQLHSLTKILCAEVGIMSTKITETLNKLEGGEEALAINQFVTNIYLEASNSCSYIQDGFQLLLPVLQQSAMENCQTMDS